MHNCHFTCSSLCHNKYNNHNMSTACHTRSTCLSCQLFVTFTTHAYTCTSTVQCLHARLVSLLSSSTSRRWSISSNSWKMKRPRLVVWGARTCVGHWWCGVHARVWGIGGVGCTHVCGALVVWGARTCVGHWWCGVHARVWGIGGVGCTHVCGALVVWGARTCVGHWWCGVHARVWGIGGVGCTHVCGALVVWGARTCVGYWCACVSDVCSEYV